MTTPSSWRSQANPAITNLREGFLDRVAERVKIINAILAATDGMSIFESDVRTIAHCAHKTAGVAETFGFAELGARALEVERVLTSRGAPIQWDIVWPAIESLLNEMQSALDA